MWLTPVLLLILVSVATSDQKPSAEIVEDVKIAWDIFIRLTNLLHDNKQEEAVKFFSPYAIVDRCDRKYDAKTMVRLWANVEKSGERRLIFDESWIRKHGPYSERYIEFAIMIQKRPNWGIRQILLLRRNDRKIIGGRFICSRTTKASAPAPAPAPAPTTERFPCNDSKNLPIEFLCPK